MKGESKNVLSFDLNGEKFAIEVRHVREIVACGPITRVPKAPAFVLGAANLRGKAIPVVDLSARLGLAPAEISRFSCLLIVTLDVAGKPTTFGVLVDAVDNLLEGEAAKLEPVPSIGTLVHPDYLLGLVVSNDSYVLVLDAQLVLSTEELMTTQTLTSPEAHP